ncbi:hypothetical protein, partial [Glaesserella parasuis]
YISANYTAEQQREILKAAPTQEGIRLQNEAIKAVTGEYIDKIVNDHHSNAEKLGEMYEVAPVSHSSYGQSQVVSAQPSNRGFNNPEPYSYEKPTYSGANSESSRQNEF